MVSWSNPYKIEVMRPCQIDFLLKVSRTHAEKLGALNLFFQKWVHRSFLFFVGEKKNTFHIFQFESFSF